MKNFRSEVLLARLILAILIVLAAFGYYVLYPNYKRAKIGAMQTGCCGNLQNIGTALDKYAMQHNGRYPDMLSRLTPVYLKAIPQCPAAKKITYEYIHSSKPEVYTVYCQGDFHPSSRRDYPQYSSVHGFVF